MDLFQKDPRPGDLRTGGRWVNPGRPARTRALVNTANVSHALIPPERFCSLPTMAQAFDVEQSVFFLARMCLFVFATSCPSESVILAVTWPGAADQWFKGRSLPWTHNSLSCFFHWGLFWGIASKAQCCQDSLTRPGTTENCSFSRGELS